MSTFRARKVASAAELSACYATSLRANNCSMQLSATKNDSNSENIESADFVVLAVRACSRAVFACCTTESESMKGLRVMWCVTERLASLSILTQTRYSMLQPS